MNSFENDIQQCVAVLQNGGLILYPTDTIWGIGCDATNEEAVAKIYALKQRPDEKSMLVLVADERQLNQYITLPHPEISEYLQTVTKPTTVIYEGAVNLAGNLINKTDGSIGIRIVKDDFCKQLIKRFRKPIVSTSANTSGQPSPRFYASIADDIKQGVDYIVQHRQEETTAAAPSSIIKRNADGSVHIIRS
ncbi:MAG: L-threonylcarbamoyladenylate synthase [Ferruginibacter sp.]